jgi:hypothetical protein
MEPSCPLVHSLSFFLHLVFPIIIFIHSCISNEGRFTIMTSFPFLSMFRRSGDGADLSTRQSMGAGQVDGF